MFYQIFFSPQVKRCAIINYKHGIYMLPHEFLNKGHSTFADGRAFVATEEKKT